MSSIFIYSLWCKLVLCKIQTVCCYGTKQDSFSSPASDTRTERGRIWLQKWKPDRKQSQHSEELSLRFAFVSNQSHKRHYLPSGKQTFGTTSPFSGWKKRFTRERLHNHNCTRGQQCSLCGGSLPLCLYQRDSVNPGLRVGTWCWCYSGAGDTLQWLPAHTVSFMHRFGKWGGGVWDSLRPSWPQSLSTSLILWAGSDCHRSSTWNGKW